MRIEYFTLKNILISFILSAMREEHIYLSRCFNHQVSLSSIRIALQRLKQVSIIYSSGTGSCFPELYLCAANTLHLYRYTTGAYDTNRQVREQVRYVPSNQKTIAELCLVYVFPSSHVRP